MPPAPARIAIVTFVLVSTAFAGCTQPSGTDGTDDGPTAMFESFDSAMDADTRMLHGASDYRHVRVRLVEPLGYQTLEPGQTEFALIVYNGSAREPIVDAEVELRAEDGSFVAPLVHDAHGVYAGTADLPAADELPTDVEVTLADMTARTFHLPLVTYDDEQAIRDAPGLTFAPWEGEQALRMKLLSPDEPLQTSSELAPFSFHLYDNATGEAVEDADATLASWMPPHGLPGGGQMEPHGTHSEIDPAPYRLGLYQGRTFHVMNGTWWTNVTVTLDDGSSATFRVTFDVGQGSHSHGDGGDDHDDHDHAHSFGSFTDAIAAHGPEREMTDLNGSATLTAKLLHPEADNATQGNQSVQILLHRPEADRPAPVPVGDVELDIHKHADGGGTVDANVSEVVHSGSGVWTADTNLTESGTWTVHVEVEDLRDRVYSGRFHVDAGEGSGGHDHDGHDHDNGH